MKIDIKSVHFEADKKTTDYAVEKIGKLEKYYKNIIKAEIVLEERTGDTVNVRYGCKTRIFIPGKDLFAEETDRNIFAAIDLVAKKLQTQVTKAKEQINPNKIHRAKKWVRDFFGKEE